MIFITKAHENYGMMKITLVDKLLGLHNMRQQWYGNIIKGYKTRKKKNWDKNKVITGTK